MKRRATLAELKAKELEEYESETDSEDEVLQEAFAKGIIKPGVNALLPEKKRKINNVAALTEKLNELQKDNIHLDWIERLDVTSKEAPIAPELSMQLQQEEKGHDPLVFDELKRESVFYRQAQDAVMSIMPKLKELGLLTKRPDDYFAEMAKSDDHMQKVKAQAIKKKLMMERVEKLRQIRAQKKLQKALNSQAKVAKVQNKKAILDEVKKYRKGEIKSLSFLDQKPQKSQGKQQQPKNKKSQMKKNYKDSKFGFGGKKRGMKKNTKTSTDVMDIKKKHFKAAAKGQKKGGSKRPGKSVRHKLKSKKR